MKYKMCVLLSLILGGCTVVDSRNFKYLDEENLELIPLQIIGAEQRIEISLPKSLAIEVPDRLVINPEALEQPYTKLLDFPYEWLWGGPARKDQGLYLFKLALHYEQEEEFLSRNVDARISATRRHYEGFEQGQWRDYVIEQLAVKAYQSKRGYWWVMENKPTVKRHHEKFTLPIAEERQLVVWFWYNEDWVKDHPEWFKRRKALSRRILDTVKLSVPK
jgi:hypothetical protein